MKILLLSVLIGVLGNWLGRRLLHRYTDSDYWVMGGILVGILEVAMVIGLAVFLGLQ